MPMVPWWYVPVSWFVVLGVLAFAATCVAMWSNHKRRKEIRERHKDHTHVPTTQVGKLSVYTNDEKDPR